MLRFAYFGGPASASGERSPAEQEAHQPRGQLRRVFVVELAGNQLQRIGTGNGVGHGAHHEMETPQDFLALHFRQRPVQRSKKALDTLGVFLGQKLADELVGLGVGTAKQAHEGMATTFHVGGHAQCGTEEGINDAARLDGHLASFCLQHVQCGQTGLVEIGQAAPKDLLDQQLLAAKVIIHCGQIHGGTAGDHAHRGAVEAVVHEQHFGCIEDAAAGVAGGLACGFVHGYR